MALRLIQVGLGEHGLGVAKHHVTASESFTLSAIVDIDSDRLARANSDLDINPECFTDYKEAFGKGIADAVYVTTASPFHYPICKSALENNLHVLVEKPFVTDIQHAMELVDIANNNGLQLMVNQNYRWNRHVIALKETIDRRVLGDPLFVDSRFFYHHKGKLYQHQMRDYMLYEMAIHHIDMMRFLFERNFATVRGRTWNMPGSGYVGDPNVQAVFELEGGLPIFYLGSLLSKGLSSPWEGNWRIQCENGSIHLEDLGNGYGVYLVDDQQAISVVPLPNARDSIRSVLAEFETAILNQQKPQSSGEDNLYTLAALIATSASSQDGQEKHPSDYLRQ